MKECPVCRFPRIVQWMAENRVSVRELARRMDVGDSTVCNIINGKSDPRLFTINAALKVTGMTFEEAFTEADVWS